MKEIERIIKDYKLSPLRSDMKFEHQIEEVSKAIEHYINKRIKINIEDWKEEFQNLEKEHKKDVIKARIEELDKFHKYLCNHSLHPHTNDFNRCIAELKKELEVDDS